MTDALRLDCLSKVYRARGDAITALDNVSLSVPEGELLALLGHNGAGKTTLMKLLLGLIAPTSGDVHVLGAQPHAAGGATARRKIGFLPENVGFTGGVSGRETLAFYARLKGEAPGSVVPSLLERVGLTEAAKRPVHTYSKGMRQRLGLAQALLGTPRLLLLDEPTTGLDPALRRTFYAILHDLTRRGTTVVLSSHVLTELELRADRIAILRRGRLIACDTLGGLRRAAGLPVRLRVTASSGGAEAVAARLGPSAEVLAINGRAVEFAVAPEQKMRMVRTLAGSAEGPDGIDDLDILPPSLEEIYAHFGEREAEP